MLLSCDRSSLLFETKWHCQGTTGVISFSCCSQDEKLCTFETSGSLQRQRGGLGCLVLMFRAFEPSVPVSLHHFLTRQAIILRTCWWKNKYHFQTSKPHDISCVILIRVVGTQRSSCWTVPGYTCCWAGALGHDTFHILLCVQQYYEVPPVVMPERALRGDGAVQFPSAKTLLSLR